MQNTKEKVYAIIKELMGNDDVELSDDAYLIDDLGFDSVQLMNLIVTLESEFGVEFDDSDMLFENFNQLSSLCDLVDQLLEKKSE